LEPSSSTDADGGIFDRVEEGEMRMGDKDIN